MRKLFYVTALSLLLAYALPLKPEFAAFVPAPALLHLVYFAKTKHNRPDAADGEFCVAEQQSGGENKLTVGHNLGYEILGINILFLAGGTLLLYLYWRLMELAPLPSPLPLLKFLIFSGTGRLVLEIIFLALGYGFCFKFFGKHELVINSAAVTHAQSFGVLRQTRRHQTKDFTGFDYRNGTAHGGILRLFKRAGGTLNISLLSKNEELIVSMFEPFLPRVPLPKP